MATPDSFLCTIKDKAHLSSAYMPFVKGGGIFVPTEKPLPLGSAVQVDLTLMDEMISFSGRVVWITPEGAQNHLPCGVGVQFTGLDAEGLRDKIEKLLGGITKSASDTM